MTHKKTTKSLPNKAGADSTSPALRRDAGLESVFEEFFRPFDHFFQPFFPGTTRSSAWEAAGFRQPTIDFEDRGDHYSLTAEIPGFTKDEVEVKVDSSGIELKADKSEKESKEEDGSYHRSRRSYYQYVSLPDQVLTEKIEGTMKNGILELKLPKSRARLTDARRVDLK
jgi:HSP20 family protein